VERDVLLLHEMIDAAEPAQRLVAGQRSRITSLAGCAQHTRISPSAGGSTGSGA